MGFGCGDCVVVFVVVVFVGVLVEDFFDYVFVVGVCDSGR